MNDLAGQWRHAIDAAQFYGPAYGRCAKQDKLDEAYKRLQMALKAEAEGKPGSLVERALRLAAVSEAEAFA